MANTVPDPKPLNQRQKLFVIEYLKDRNATAAYKRAGYKATGNAAEVIACQLLRNPQIALSIAKASEQAVETFVHETGITLERTLREIAKVAFHDPRKFFHDGHLQAITSLDDETAAALAGFEVTEEFEGSGQERKSVGYTKKIKQADRAKYLDMLMKHLGGYKKDNEQAPPPAPEVSLDDSARRIAFLLASALHNSGAQPQG